jgi:hypothetical protein
MYLGNASFEQVEISVQLRSKSRKTDLPRVAEATVNTPFTLEQ